MNLSDPIEPAESSSQDDADPRLSRVSLLWAEIFLHAFGVGVLALFGGLVWKVVQWLL